MALFYFFCRCNLNRYLTAINYFIHSLGCKWKKDKYEGGTNLEFVKFGEARFAEGVNNHYRFYHSSFYISTTKLAFVSLSVIVKSRKRKLQFDPLFIDKLYFSTYNIKLSTFHLILIEFCF